MSNVHSLTNTLWKKNKKNVFEITFRGLAFPQANLSSSRRQKFVLNTPQIGYCGFSQPSVNLIIKLNNWCDSVMTQIANTIATYCPKTQSVNFFHFKLHVHQRYFPALVEI